MRRPKPSSRPPSIRKDAVWSRFPPTKDGWKERLRIGLRMGNGAVLSSKQVQELAGVLGIRL
jgi:hypothetical protein